MGRLGVASWLLALQRRKSRIVQSTALAKCACLVLVCVALCSSGKAGCSVTGGLPYHRPVTCNRPVTCSCPVTGGWPCHTVVECCCVLYSLCVSSEGTCVAAPLLYIPAAISQRTLLPCANRAQSCRVPAVQRHATNHARPANTVTLACTSDINGKLLLPPAVATIADAARPRSSAAGAATRDTPAFLPAHRRSPHASACCKMLAPAATLMRRG